jgi:hypothetical protein
VFLKRPGRSAECAPDAVGYRGIPAVADGGEDACQDSGDVAGPPCVTCCSMETPGSMSWWWTGRPVAREPGYGVVAPA